MHQQHLTTAQTAMSVIYSIKKMLLDTSKGLNQSNVSTSFHFTALSHFTNHHVSNTSTAPYYSRNYIAIRLFFQHQCFWTHQTVSITRMSVLPFTLLP
jgi:hypothetical protein